MLKYKCHTVFYPFYIKSAQTRLFLIISVYFEEKIKILLRVARGSYVSGNEGQNLSLQEGKLDLWIYDLTKEVICLLYFFFHFMKTSRFLWNFTHKRRELNFPFRVWDLWNVVQSIIYAKQEYFYYLCVKRNQDHSLLPSKIDTKDSTRRYCSQG